MFHRFFPTYRTRKPKMLAYLQVPYKTQTRNPVGELPDSLRLYKWWIVADHVVRRTSFTAASWSGSSGRSFGPSAKKVQCLGESIVGTAVRGGYHYTFGILIDCVMCEDIRSRQEAMANVCFFNFLPRIVTQDSLAPRRLTRSCRPVHHC